MRHFVARPPMWRWALNRRHGGAPVLAAPLQTVDVRCIETAPLDISVHSLGEIAAQPGEVVWLLNADSGSSPRAVKVDLGPEIERAHNESSAASTSLDRSASADLPRRDLGALADRLRAATAVPLDRLLKQRTSALDWPSALMPYQQVGVRALIERPRMLLADDMGLGKTVQAIAAMRILCHQGKIERTLLIVPARLFEQWLGEFRRWSPELRVIAIRGLARDRTWQWQAPAYVTVVSYETLRADMAGCVPARGPRQEWDLVVLDEAQKIKNRESDTSRAVKQLRRQRSWAMTGTPLENRIDDLASILEFVDHADDGRQRLYAPSRALIERHRQLQLRRRKADVLSDLPPKHVVHIRLPLLPLQQLSYERAERDGVVQLRQYGAAIRIEHILALITRLKQLCNRDPVSGESAKLADIRERLMGLGAEGHRAILFSQYADANFGVAAAANHLAEFAPLTFTGSMSGADRDAVIERFKRETKHRALILSLRAGGVGLNLQTASYVFHLDRWWNPAVERQAEDRAHRLGQTYPVTVVKYTCVATIEERIGEYYRKSNRSSMRSSMMFHWIDPFSFRATICSASSTFRRRRWRRPRAPKLGQRRRSSPPGARRSSNARDGRCDLFPERARLDST